MNQNNVLKIIRFCDKKYVQAKGLAQFCGGGSKNSNWLSAWSRFCTLATHCGLYNLIPDDFVSVDVCKRMAEYVQGRTDYIVFFWALESIFGVESQTTVKVKSILPLICSFEEMEYTDEMHLVDLPSEEELLLTLEDTANRLRTSTTRLLCRMLRCHWIRYSSETQGLIPNRTALRKNLLQSYCGFTLITHDGRKYLSNVAD